MCHSVQVGGQRICLGVGVLFLPYHSKDQIHGIRHDGSTEPSLEPTEAFILSNIAENSISLSLLSDHLSGE